MKPKLKITLIVLACLAAFQMFFRYDIHSTGETTNVYDRLTQQGYVFKGRYSLFPWPMGHAPVGGIRFK